jgi:phosphoglycerate kinase
MSFRPFDSLDVFQKRVLLRVDFNVPLEQNKILDDFRIQQTLPTIKLLKEKKAKKIILVSHLGRPLKQDKKFSLKPVFDYLEGLIDEKIYFLKTSIGKELSEEIMKLPDNSIILLENIRFYQEEKENDKNFAKELAKIADCFINEAFSVSHREASSLCAITEFLPSYSGKLLEKEIANLDKILKNPEKPLVIVLGGAKTKDKLPLIKEFLEKADYILLGGVIANTVLKANDFSIGQSFFEKEVIGEAKEIGSKKAEVVLPGDFVVLNKENKTQIKELGLIDDKDSIFDIGSMTINSFFKIISEAKTVFFNGPMGKFEDTRFSKGTNEVLKAILGNNKAFSVIGGGETIASFKKLNSKFKILDSVFLSTGGGAILEYLADKPLPGLKALKNLNKTL